MEPQDNLRRRTIATLAALALGASLAGGACGGGDLPSDQTSSTTSSGDTATSTSTSTTTSSGGTGGSGGTTGTGGAGTGGTGGAPDCSTNPMTHLEIINACTDAQKLDAMPSLPLLLPDGSLPPLP